MRDVLDEHLAERATQDSHCRSVSAGRPHSGSAGPQSHQGGIGLRSTIPAKTQYLGTTQLPGGHKALCQIALIEIN
jgi:hypothetical protein